MCHWQLVVVLFLDHTKSLRNGWYLIFYKGEMRQVGFQSMAPHRLVLNVLSVGPCGKLGTCSALESFGTSLPLVIPYFPYIIK